MLYDGECTARHKINPPLKNRDFVSSFRLKKYSISLLQEVSAFNKA